MILVILLVIIILYLVFRSGNEEGFYQGTRYGVHTHTACDNICKGSPGCNSIHHDPTTNQCHLYTDPDYTNTYSHVLPATWVTSWPIQYISPHGRRYYGNRWHTGKWRYGHWRT